MLCEVFEASNLLGLYILISFLGCMTVIVSSGICFTFTHVYASYTTWKWKSNPKYTPILKVREEVIQVLKGACVISICPSLALWMSSEGHSQAYCGWEGDGTWELAQFFIIWIGTDFYEFLYHHLGHRVPLLWGIYFQFHKFHHTFFNPTPFAVIADEWQDNIIRGLPLLLFPIIMPTNIDLMFAIFTMFFYVSGTYLHSGHEIPWLLSAHHPIFNSSYQHYIHHSRASMNKPLHTAFYFKIWDQLFDTCEDESLCSCTECEQSKGKRTLEEWQKVEVPDYMKYFKDWKFWVHGMAKTDEAEEEIVLVN